MNQLISQDKVIQKTLEVIEKSGRETNTSPAIIAQTKKAFLLRYQGKSTTCAFYPRKRYANK